MKNCPNCGVRINDDSLFCTECGKPIPQGITCPHCGASVNDGDTFCQSCGKKMDEVSKTKRRQAEAQRQIASQRLAASQWNGEEQEAKSSNGLLLTGIILGVLLLLLLGGGSYLYYDKVYLPEKIDREAPRYYTFANSVILRSSKLAGVDNNKVTSLPYGTELITYDQDSEWCKVKVNSSAVNADKVEGFVASDYVLPKSDFLLLNSIFGDTDSKELIESTRSRRAMLDYFKRNQYIGKIDEEQRIEAGITTVPNGSNQWQVFSLPKDAKLNTIMYKKAYNPNSRYPDLAVIIKNLSSGNRKLLYFYFDDEGKPTFLAEQEAPTEGYIKNVIVERDSYSDLSYLNVSFAY